MDFVVIGIAASFMIVLVVAVFKIHISLSLLLGSIVLGLFSMPPPELFSTSFQALIAPSTLDLMLSLVSITLLNIAYTHTGASHQLIESLRNLVPQRLLIAVIPVIFGILPVSGGALFSAPFVDQEGEDMGLEMDRRTFLNMWFRHVPLVLYPLETALVIAAYLSGVDLTLMILYQVPVFIIGVVVGYFLGLRGVAETKGASIDVSHLKQFLISFSPILVTVSLITVFRLKIFLAATIGATCLFALKRVSLPPLTSHIQEILKIALLSYSISLYRTLFQASGALVAVTNLVQSGHIDPAILLATLPFLIGFLIGESSPATTILFSILGRSTLTAPAACLAFTCMYFGHLISPLHLCFAVTAEFFKTSLSQMYRRLLPATMLTLSLEAPLMILLL